MFASYNEEKILVLIWKQTPDLQTSKESITV